MLKTSQVYIQGLLNRVFYEDFYFHNIRELLEKFILYKSMYNFESIFRDFEFANDFDNFKIDYPKKVLEAKAPKKQII